MDFNHVIGVLFVEFDRRDIRYALMGGVGLGALGVSRTTMDVDVLIHRDDLVALHEILTGLGYEKPYADGNVSRYRHRDPHWGQLDFIHAFRAHAVSALGRATRLLVMGGSKAVPVLTPEDLIGFKVQGMVNDPDRAALDRADIEGLIVRHRTSLDWFRIEEYYRVFGLEAEYCALEDRFRHV